MKIPRGIAGVKGIEPWQAAVALKIRSHANAAPKEGNRFHIVVPRNVHGFRPHHPLFRAWNELPPEGSEHYERELAKRQLLRAQFVHAKEEEIWQWNVAAWVLGKPWPTPPQRRYPACTGDGKKATRFVGPNPDDFQEINCPNEKCEFRLPNPKTGEPGPCGPQMRMMFRLVFSEESRLPSVIVKFTSGGWETIKGFIGFFERINAIAEEMGIENPNLMGFPFTLTRADRTRPDLKHKWPVAIPGYEMFPSDFFQTKMLKRLVPGTKTVPAIEHFESSLVEDIADIKPGFGREGIRNATQK